MSDIEHAEPIAEAHSHLQNVLRTLLTAAAGVAERTAERRRRLSEEAGRASAEQRRALEAHADAERRAARDTYRPAMDHRWWPRAEPRAVVNAAVAAHTWADHDPQARAAYDEISAQLRDRHNIHVEQLWDGTHPDRAASLRDTLEQRRAATAGKADETDRWRPELLAAAGETLAADIASSSGWPRLQGRLDDLAANGDDITGRLGAAVASRSLNGTHDKAATLMWRLRGDAAHPGPRPQGQRGPTARNTNNKRPTMSGETAARTQRTQARTRPADPGLNPER